MVSFRWYVERSPAAAARWLGGLTRSMNSLAKNPGRHPLSPDDSEALGCEVRVLLYGRRRGVFRILFAIDGDTVTVLRIRHSAQGPIEP